MDPVSVTVRVPATSANLGAGFDCLGMALDMFASVTVTFSEVVQPPTEDVGEKMVLTAMRSAFERMGRPTPAGMKVEYGLAIPLGRGLGASAVARVAGALAANEFSGRPLDREACLAIASDLEGHGDNACPAMFGGMQVCVHSERGYVHVPCRYPQDAAIALLIPEHPMPTKEARRALPDSYSRADTVHNIGRVALFVAAMAAGRMDVLDEATQDRVHQQQRAPLFPPMFDVFAAAKGAGAYAAWLSGAGSTIAAICSQEASRDVTSAMAEALQRSGIPGRALATRIAREGAEVAKVELARV